MLIERLAAAGADGVGQSSWGPTVYAIVAGPEQAQRMEALARGWLGERGAVHNGGFLNHGARVWTSIPEHAQHD